MSKKFETPTNLEREQRAIKFWTSHHAKNSYEKLGAYDIDFRVYSDKSNTYAYAEVKGRNRHIKDAYPLPLAARKLVKIHDRLKNDPETKSAFIIWACDDGIIVGNIEKIIGTVRIGGRAKREGSSNDIEVMVEYKEQDPLLEKTY